MQHLTTSTKAKDIKREWHVIDVKNKVLGRESTVIANLLMGKSKSYYTTNLDCGDYVIVLNAKEVALTGKKETQKVYTRYSGYPGGLRKMRVEEVRAQKPTDLITHSVKGMLPKNRLRDRMLTRLYVFSGPEHNMEEQMKQSKDEAK